MGSHTLKQHSGAGLGVQPIGHLDQDVCRYCYLLGIGARHAAVGNQVAHLYVCHALTDSRNHACCFSSRGQRKASGRGSSSSASIDIGEVDANGLNV